MSVTFPVKPITIEHDPCDASYKDTYTLQLQSPAEANGGDHLCVIDFTQNRANVDWWYFDGVNDIPIGVSQSFLFTSANETYTLKARLKQDVQNVEFKPMRYTVSALYAPMWAHGEGFILPSVGTYSTECGLQITTVKTCYNPGLMNDHFGIVDDGFTTVQYIINFASPSPGSLIKTVGANIKYSRRNNFGFDTVTPVTAISGTLWRASTDLGAFLIAKIRTVHPVNGTITHCRAGYESVYPTWVCTPGATLRVNDISDTYWNTAAGAAPIQDTVGTRTLITLLSYAPGFGLLWSCVGAWTPATQSGGSPTASTFSVASNISYGLAYVRAAQEYSGTTTVHGVTYNFSVNIEFVGDCSGTGKSVRIRRVLTSYSISYPAISCSQGDSGTTVQEIDVATIAIIGNTTLTLVLKTTTRIFGIGNSLGGTSNMEVYIRETTV